MENNRYSEEYLNELLDSINAEYCELENYFTDIMGEGRLISNCMNDATGKVLENILSKLEQLNMDLNTRSYNRFLNYKEI